MTKGIGRNRGGVARSHSEHQRTVHPQNFPGIHSQLTQGLSLKGSTPNTATAKPILPAHEPLKTYSGHSTLLSCSSVSNLIAHVLEQEHRQEEFPKSLLSTAPWVDAFPCWQLRPSHVSQRLENHEMKDRKKIEVSQIHQLRLRRRL